MKLLKMVSLITLLLSLGCVQTAIDEEMIKSEILTVMAAQVAGWNAGDIPKFMSSYQQSDSMRFVSGVVVSYGWQTLLERYENGYPDKAAMGTLSFTDVDVTVLSDAAALVFGKWALKRDLDEPWGYFTLVFRKTEGGWKVVHDHTSSG